MALVHCTVVDLNRVLRLFYGYPAMPLCKQTNKHVPVTAGSSVMAVDRIINLEEFVRNIELKV